MSGKKKYLIGCKDSAVVPLSVESMVTSYVSGHEDIEIVRKLRTGQHIIAMTAKQASMLGQKHPELIIEDDQELELLFPMPGLMPTVPVDSELLLKVKVIDEETKRSVKDVTIYGAGMRVMYKGITDRYGKAEVKVFETNLNYIIASPKDTYWSKVTSSLVVKEKEIVEITLKRIQVDGNYSWGHKRLGVEKVSRTFTGRGVKIALIDSGVTAHVDLDSSGGYNTLDGQNTQAWNIDEMCHGTHCAGIIAAQQNGTGVTGVAPDAELYSIKIFPGGRFSDFVEAVNWCIDNYMDVISMSVGSSIRSDQLEMALYEANERGIICVAAAGNNGGAVSYPAAYDHVIAVSSIGELGVFPQDSAHVLKIGSTSPVDKNLFFASFSNFGPEINLCAPGVAILSTVPTGYASWDGTSMACPLVSGLTALILEAYPETRTGDAWQSYYVREILNSSAVDLGFPPELQGAGLPMADLALATACSQREYENEMLTTYREAMRVMLQRVRHYEGDIEQALKDLNVMIDDLNVPK